MKNKVFAGLAAMTLVAAMALPAAAAPANDTQTTTLNAFKDSSYTLTIPSSTTVVYGTQSTEIGSLKVVGNVNVNDSVTVSATLNDFVRAGSATDKIAFSLKDHAGTTVKDFAATTWSEAELRAATAKEVPLTVDIPTATWTGAKAGSYTGSIVFTATYNNAN